MKRILILIIGLIGVAYGQSSPTSAKTRFVNGLYLGTKLDSYFNAADSNAIYWRADSALMAKYKGTARALAFAVSGGYIPYSDTTSLLSQVVRTFGTQTVGGNKTLNDSIIFKSVTRYDSTAKFFKRIIISPTGSQYSSGESGPAIFIQRSITTEASGNERAITDGSIFNRSTKAYASFDAQPTFTGSNNYDHFAGFQSRAVMNTSGTTSNYYSFVSIPDFQQGTTTNLYHFLANGKTGVGTATNEYGIYIGTLAGTNKWGIYQNGIADKNYLAGTTLIAGAADDATNKLIVNGGVKFGSSGTTSITSTGSITFKEGVWHTSDGGNRFFFNSDTYFGIKSGGNWYFQNNAASNVVTITESGAITAASFIKSGGTSTQALMADGSVITVATGSTASSIAQRDGSGNLTAAAATFSSSVTASSFVKSGGTSSQALIADGSVQTLTSGTYTATLTNIANLTSSTQNGSFQYTRVGDIVTVSGNINLNITSNNTLTQLAISLPIASNFGGATDANGIFTVYGAGQASNVGRIIGDATNDRVQVDVYTALYSGSQTSYFQFTYKIF